MAVLNEHCPKSSIFDPDCTEVRGSEISVNESVDNSIEHVKS